MTFLALQPQQVLWLVAATAAAVLIVFFLKIRRPPVFVPSLLLWQRLIDEQSARSLIERLRRIISLLLALAIALALAVALARPSRADAARPVVIVLDTAPSLQARTRDGATRWQHAQQRARDIARAHGGSARFVIAETGGTASRDVRTLAEALAVIDELKPGLFEGVPALEIDDADAYLITDGVRINEAPRGVELISVFERAPNVSVTAFELDATETGGTAAIVEVANDSDAAAQVELIIEGHGAAPIKRSFALGAGGRHRDRVDVAAFDAGVLRAVLTRPTAPDETMDALPDDNVGVAYLPRRGSIRVLLVSKGNDFLRAVLASDKRARFSELTPEALGDREVADVDVYVFDGQVPARLPDAPMLLLRPPADAWKTTLASIGRLDGSVSAPRVTDAVEHPVTRAVSWTDVRIDRADRVALTRGASGVVSVARAGLAPLVIAHEADRRLIVTFDLRESDFPFQPAFPIFMRNAIEWLARDAPAEVRRAGVVEVAGDDVKVATVDGARVATRRMMGSSLFDARTPAAFAVDADGRRQYLVVSVADATASRINASRLAAGQTRSASTSPLPAEWWRALLVVALVLVALEWWTYQRRITV